jgi:hypothetical protein
MVEHSVFPNVLLPFLISVVVKTRSSLVTESPALATVSFLVAPGKAGGASGFCAGAAGAACPPGVTTVVPLLPLLPEFEATMITMITMITSGRMKRFFLNQGR